MKYLEIMKYLNREHFLLIILATEWTITQHNITLAELVLFDNELTFKEYVYNI
jgi:hypothetical protein